MRKCRIINLIFLFVAVFYSLETSAQIDSIKGRDTLIVLPTIDTVGIFPDSTKSQLSPTDLQFLSDTVKPAEEPIDPDFPLPYGTSLENLSLRMVTGQTTKVLQKHVLEFCVQHRFGYFSQGKTQAFGFDQSDVRLGFDYGLTRKLTIGVGRSSLGKSFNGYLKFGLLKQSPRSFFSVTWLSDMNVSGLRNTNPDLKPYFFSHRLRYTHQLIASHTFGERFMFMMAPTVIHRNLVDSAKIPNDLTMLVVSGRLKLRKGMNLTAEYAYNFNINQRKNNRPCLGIGWELYTSGHIFQIVFTNTNSMNEADAYTMNNGIWNKGNFRMGFNIVRRF